MNTSISLASIVSLGAALVFAGCGSGRGSSSSSDNTVTINGDVPIAYAKRANTIMMNPTDGAPSAPGGDLIIREKSSASAREINVNAGITQGVGDVSDPEVSYDAGISSSRCAARPATSPPPLAARRPALARGTSGSTTPRAAAWRAVACAASRPRPAAMM